MHTIWSCVRGGVVFREDAGAVLGAEDQDGLHGKQAHSTRHAGRLRRWAILYEVDWRQGPSNSQMPPHPQFELAGAELSVGLNFRRAPVVSLSRAHGPHRFNGKSLYASASGFGVSFTRS